MTPVAQAPAVSAEPPLRILLVEDDEFDVAVFRRAFRQSEIPCEIVRCRHGEEALEGLRDAELSLDLVVADHQLPGMSGFDLCLRLLEGEPPFALVLLTGGGSEQMAIRALRAGIQDYIVKDSSQEYLDLLPLVLPRVARRHRERRLRRLPEPSSTAGDSRHGGLADCVVRVRHLGGRTWVEGAGGPSPELCFAVPLSAAEAAAWKADVASAGDAASHRGPSPGGGGPVRGSDADPPAGTPARRVLIAHSNPVVRYVTSRAVEEAGYRLVAVGDGRRAVEALEHEPFDLVLMGLRMREMDGLEATRRIRANEDSARRRTPIVALGTDPEAGEAETCEAAGMDASVPRPVEPRGLSAALARWVAAPR